MTNENQRELVAYVYLVLGLLVPALIGYIVVSLRHRTMTTRAASQDPALAPLSPASAVLRSLRWGSVATLLAAALCFVPGVNLLCYGALMLAAALAAVVGIPVRHLEVASCILLLITLFLFFTAFRFTQLVGRHGFPAPTPNDRNS
jgi:hypothetical protein